MKERKKNKKYYLMKNLLKKFKKIKKKMNIFKLY